MCKEERKGNGRKERTEGREVKNKRRKEGRKEGGKRGGREGGRKEGRKAGWKEGRSERRMSKQIKMKKCKNNLMLSNCGLVSVYEYG